MRPSYMIAAVALAMGMLVGPSTVEAQTANPYERGPAPTLAGTGTNGTFATASVTVPRQSGFGGGTIHYPTDTSQGTFGGVAVAPGFFGPQSAIAWWGPRLASHGFVVITIDTNTLWDFSASRAAQLQAALNYLTRTSTVRTRVDATRLAVIGHSMGGGGALQAARNNPALQAAVPLQMGDFFVEFSGVRVPSMLIAAQNDGLVQQSETYYEQIPAASEKAYLELAGADHLVASDPSNITQARLALTWLKRYVDNDTRYEQFLCPAPSGPGISEYRNTCPG